MKVVAVLFLVVSVLIVENSALLCYTCFNHNQEQCAAKRDPPLLATTNCPTTPREEKEQGGRAHCYKTEKAWVFEPNNETYVYTRGCTVAGGITDFCDEEKQKDPEIKCYLCDTDWCNGGNNLKVFNILMIIGVFNVIFISYL